MKKSRRTGAAAVEAACCLPVLMLIVFSAIEVSGGIFQEYDLQVTAFELSKTALESGNSCADVQAFAEQIMPQLGFEDYEVTIEVEPRTVNNDSVESVPATSFSFTRHSTPPSGLELLPRGTLLRLTLVADRPAVSGGRLMGSLLNAEIDADCVFVKEL